MKQLILISFCLISFSSFAQNSTLSYATGAPIGSYTDFISEYSWKGIEVGIQQKWGDKFAYGFHYRYLNFYEKRDRATYEFENGAITTVRYTYSFVSNFNLSLNYFHHNNSKFTPYTGLAAGPAFIRNRLIIGYIDISANNFRFSISPQAGIIIELTPDLALDLKVNYNFIPLQYENFKNIQFIGVSLGVTWPE